jgi:serine protease Do
VYRNKWDFRSYFLLFSVSLFALSLILGYTGSARASSGLSELEESLVHVSEEVKLSVVSITTVKVFKHPATGGYHGDQYGRGRGHGGGGGGHGGRGRGGPFDEFFDKFVPKAPPKGEYKTQSLGSGVIVKIDGEKAYILTNNHVVADMDELKVKLSDKREFDAEIVGTDEQTDLAVIKIEGKNLKAAKMGDSEALKQGQWAIAIGNPFGLTHTVSVGVVSAIGRSGVGIANYENFIQTDAAINPGNSGGPLLNIDGEIIGINTAIFTRSGGYQGIGFAIPVNMAKAVLRDLIDKGKVTRGWLGVAIQNMDESLAEQFGVEVTEGVLISDVQDGSPAQEAGFERGDIVIGYNNREISDVNRLRNFVAQTQVGKKVKVKVLRKEKEKILTVKIGEQPSDLFASGKPSAGNDLGISVQNLTEELAKSFEFEGETGVVVTAVEPGSSAAQADIKEGDLIKEVNREKINNLEEFSDALKRTAEGKDILFLLRRGQHTRFVIIKSK